MGDAPERIWATVNGASTDVISGQRGLVGGWHEHGGDRPRAIEYRRADLPLTLQQAMHHPEVWVLVETMRALLIRADRLVPLANRTWRKEAHDVLRQIGGDP